MKPRELIQQFISERLNGDINKLATFPLWKLWHDDVYGCPDRKFDSDDTELMRAVYYLVFKDAWVGLSMDSLANYSFRGDTINTYRTIFGNSSFVKGESHHAGLDRYNPSSELSKKTSAYCNIVGTIGNMMVLPNNAIRGHSYDEAHNYICYEWTINKHRGMHPVWHDYEDRFLVELYKVLTGKPDKDIDLQDIVDANMEHFKPYVGEDGWNAFIRNNMLEGYCNEDMIPQITSKGYFYWQNCYCSDKHYCEEAERFADFATAIICDRAARIIEKLKNVIS